MTTEVRKKSKYDSDETPNREDRKKAEELFYQDGAPSAILMAEEMAMQRRKTVEDRDKADKMNKKIDRILVTSATNENAIADQGSKQITMMSKQADISDAINQIHGMGKFAVFFIPTLITIIGLILAFYEPS